MSITFNLLTIHTDGGEMLGEICDCREVLASEGHRSECEDFDVYRYCDHVEDRCGHNLHAVNLSNANARDVLTRMGFVPEDSGRCEADVLLRRAMRLANGKSMALATTTIGGDGRATMHDLGRGDDYHTRVGTRLMALAIAARDQGLRVGWC